MADIFEEVEEGLRQDKLAETWKKYGVFAYLAGALIIGGVALNEYLKDRAAQTVDRNAGRLEVALTELDERNYETAGAALSELAGEKIPLAPVAGHYLAAVRLDGNGDAAAAAEALTAAAGEARSPTEKLAALKAAYLKADTLSRADLQPLLAPLLESDDGFAALAQELMAAKALQEGDLEFARREFNFLQLSQTAPPGVLRRARQALDAMPAVVETPEPATQTGSPDAVASEADAETSAPAEGTGEREETPE